MLFGEYHFQGVLEDDAILPPFKGSTFRGVFGRALKEVVCALKRQDCPTCLLRHQCVYTQVFDFPPNLQPRGSPHPPLPFVIQPPLDSRTNLPQGDHFNFTLLLFGPTNHYLPYFVYAFEEMGRIGIGRKFEGQRARFQLLSVSCPYVGVIYRNKDKSLSPPQPKNLTVADLIQPGRSVTEITLSLMTPLRLKFKNRFQSEMPFHVLMRAVLRRTASLFSFFGNGEPPLDYRGLVAKAQDVRVVNSTLRWLDWRRYSFQQADSMYLGGLVGSVTYRGNLGEYLPLLCFAEKVHIGKNSAFGLGMIKLSSSFND